MKMMAATREIKRLIAALEDLDDNLPTAECALALNEFIQAVVGTKGRYTIDGARDGIEYHLDGTGTWPNDSAAMASLNSCKGAC